jgi:hypothetical protein
LPSHKGFSFIRTHVAFDAGGPLYAGMSVVLFPMSKKKTPSLAWFAPEYAAYFAPESLVDFTPEYVADFSPE